MDLSSEPLRVSDKQEKDIGVVAAGGLVDLIALSSFCSGTSCKVNTLYDQTGNGNDMWRADTAATRPCDLMDIAHWQMSDGANVPSRWSTDGSGTCCGRARRNSSGVKASQQCVEHAFGHILAVALAEATAEDQVRYAMNG
jgi:hypothetical protein